MTTAKAVIEEALAETKKREAEAMKVGLKLISLDRACGEIMNQKLNPLKKVDSQARIAAAAQLLEMYIQRADIVQELKDITLWYTEDKKQ